MTHSIYTLSHPVTNEIFYVGCTQNVRHRMIRHCYGYSKLLQKQGRSLASKDYYILSCRINPVCHVIEEVKNNLEEALQRERFWIFFLLHHRFPLVNDTRRYIQGMDFNVDDLPYKSIEAKRIFTNKEGIVSEDIEVEIDQELTKAA